jgi:hypothetical protein
MVSHAYTSAYTRAQMSMATHQICCAAAVLCIASGQVAGGRRRGHDGGVRRARRGGRTGQAAGGQHSGVHGRRAIGSAGGCSVQCPHRRRRPRSQARGRDGDGRRLPGRHTCTQPHTSVCVMVLLSLERERERETCAYPRRRGAWKAAPAEAAALAAAESRARPSQQGTARPQTLLGRAPHVDSCHSVPCA